MKTRYDQRHVVIGGVYAAIGIQHTLHITHCAKYTWSKRILWRIGSDGLDPFTHAQGVNYTSGKNANILNKLLPSKCVFKLHTCCVWYLLSIKIYYYYHSSNSFIHPVFFFDKRVNNLENHHLHTLQPNSHTSRCWRKLARWQRLLHGVADPPSIRFGWVPLRGQWQSAPECQPLLQPPIARSFVSLVIWRVY